MINFTETESAIDTTLIADWVSIRQQIEVLEAKRREIEPIVINQALAQYGQNFGRHTVYSETGVKVILQFREDKKAILKDQDIQHFDELIQLESEQACRQNAQQIAEMERRIKELEAALIGLKQTDEGLRLVARREKLAKAISCKTPVLVLRS